MSDTKLKPMDLKVQTACCGVKALLWSREKRYYTCPCGTMKVNETGRLVGKQRPYFDPKAPKNV